MTQDDINQAIEQAEIYHRSMVDAYQKWRDETDEAEKEKLWVDYNNKSQDLFYHFITKFPAPDLSNQEQIKVLRTEAFRILYPDDFAESSRQEQMVNTMFVVPPVISAELIPIFIMRVTLGILKCKLFKNQIPSWVEFEDLSRRLIAGQEP